MSIRSIDYSGIPSIEGSPYLSDIVLCADEIRDRVDGLLQIFGSMQDNGDGSFTLAFYDTLDDAEGLGEAGLLDSFIISYASQPYVINETVNDSPDEHFWMQMNVVGLTALLLASPIIFTVDLTIVPIETVIENDFAKLIPSVMRKQSGYQFDWGSVNPVSQTEAVYPVTNCYFKGEIPNEGDSGGFTSSQYNNKIALDVEFQVENPILDVGQDMPTLAQLSAEMNKGIYDWKRFIYQVNSQSKWFEIRYRGSKKHWGRNALVAGVTTLSLWIFYNQDMEEPGLATP